MAEKLSKRDFVMFALFVTAPFIAFNMMTWNGALVEMLENPVSRLYYGFGASIVWVVIWAIALGIDHVWKKRIERKEAEDMEIDDPSLAFGYYLFDKEK